MAKTYIIIQGKRYTINYQSHMKSIYYILECSVLCRPDSRSPGTDLFNALDLALLNAVLTITSRTSKSLNKHELNRYKGLCVFRNQDTNQRFSPTAGVRTEEKSGIFYAQVWERLLLCSVNPCPHIYWGSQGESGSHSNHKNTLTCTRKHFITL